MTQSSTRKSKKLTPSKQTLGALRARRALPGDRARRAASRQGIEAEMLSMIEGGAREDQLHAVLVARGFGQDEAGPIASRLGRLADAQREEPRDDLARVSRPPTASGDARSVVAALLILVGACAAFVGFLGILFTNVTAGLFLLSLGIISVGIAARLCRES